MGKISEEQFSIAYHVSKEVFKGNLKRKEGILLLSNEHNLNKASAGDFIYCFKCMMGGRIFHRAMSYKAMDYFIGSIANDFSSDRLNNALSALEKHIYYWETHYERKAVAMGRVLDKYQNSILTFFTAESIQLKFDQEIVKSTGLSSTERLKIISRSSPFPRQMIVSNVVYQRNPNVVVERLDIAAGICERCKMKAPFIRAKDGTPYLEIHHTQRLSDGGSDTLENTIALCPNCHRELHFGKSG